MQKAFLKKNEITAIESLKKELSSRFNLLDLRIFGSKARKEDTPESDIDIFIEIDNINSDIEAEIDDIVYKINLENDTFISTIIFGKKEIEEGPMSESPIYKVILKEGVPV